MLRPLLAIVSTNGLRGYLITAIDDNRILQSTIKG